MALNSKDKERYSRQISLKEFGEKSQLKLSNAKVLVIGAGGLGCPVLQYLAATGIGIIGIVDDDIISLSNLHRQILYTTNDIGLFKSQRAAAVLQQLNPSVITKPHTVRIDASNALEVIKAYDIVIDGTDNFASRYLINDACVLLNKPLIYGSVYHFEGQVAIFNVTNNNNEVATNYRDLFPQQPKIGEVPSCNEGGVIGILPGIIGTMMANECIKLITGIGNPLINTLIIYNSLNNSIFEINITPKKDTISKLPADVAAFKLTDYSFECELEHSFTDVGIDEFIKLMQEEETIVIDVREKDEKPIITAFSYTNIPMSELTSRKSDITQKNILLFCHSGVRSITAAAQLFNGSNKIYNLRGGIIRYNIS